MNNTDKLTADAQRIKKHYRSEHSSYDGYKVCCQIQELFVKNNRNIHTLAESISGYWLHTYIEPSIQMENEPTEEHLAKLGAMQAFLDASDGLAEGTESLNQEDWDEIKDAVNYEAEDLPLEMLNDMMMVIMDHTKI